MDRKTRAQRREERAAHQGSSAAVRKRNKMVLNTIVAVVVLAAAVALGYYLLREPAPSPLDSFAQCTAKRGLTMYGTAWCPHCQEQKAMFDESFRFVRYVDCDKNAQVCLSNEVTGYPTWILSGERFEGKQSLEYLADITQCMLPTE
jgi:glutaredoxin